MSASASKSTSSPVTTTTDRRVAADGGAVVLGDGARLETLADDVALAAIDKAQESAVTSAKLAATVNADSLDLAGDAITTGAQLAKALNSDALDFAEGVTASNYKQTSQTLETVGQLSGDNAQLAAAMAELAVDNVTRTANPSLATSDSLITAGVAVAAVGLIAYALKK